ncbi:hypothetical protein Q7P37_008611 [Cladosporium fusiforme]
MPPKGKLKNAPNQHDKRHESGLAAPGRRVTKQRSNTHLSATSNGKPVHVASPLPSPTAAVTSATAFPPASPNDPAALDSLACSVAKNHAAPANTAQHRDRTASEASFEEVVSPGGDMMADNNMHDYASHASHAESPPTANKSTAPPAGSTLAIVSTILTYYPLRDAISILILLLSLPPTLVLVIQTLFASLTFVPPTAGISLSTLPNVKDMFNASSLGYPALATILLVDLIFYLCWLPVWKPMQTMFLDLSQTVIAVSLSGAASSNGGPTYSILTCSTVVCVVHVLRYKAIHLTALDYLRSVLHRMDLGFDVNVPSAASSFLFSSPSQHGWLYTAVRTMLGIHIVSQGVTTCIRRSLANANERSSNTPSISKSDPEATAGADSAPRSYSADDLKHPAQNSNGDARPPGPSPAHRESKVRESSKKKRKQANQVRSQQPLWAAIASTKVTFVKEMEQRDAADDAKEAASMDNDTNDTYTHSATNSTDRFWTREVHDTDIQFGVELTSQSATETVKGASDVSLISPGIDKSKPFFIRVNGAAWGSTTITPSAAKNDSTGRWWQGEIFGLAPLSSYHCEVVGIASQRVLCSANLITLPAPTAEQAASFPAQPQQQALRPSSPVTTLRQSIQQAESKLNEARNKSKKSKKDQRAAHADVKREINMLKSKLDGSGGVDDKQARRLQQITQHKNQAEEATIEVKKEMESLGEIPADELAASERKRRAWQSATEARNNANRELEAAKADAERTVKDLKSEIAAIAAKREKLTSRHLQRKEELGEARNKQQADQTAKFRHDAERAQKRAEQDHAEAQMRYHTSAMQAEADNFQHRALETYQQAVALQSWPAGAAPPGFMGISSPPTPENQLPNTNGALGTNNGNGYSSFAPMQFANGFQPGVPAPRGRSSSMLSQYSGFTDNGEDYLFEPRQQNTWPLANANANAFAGAAVVDERNQSEGSGSNGNGSTASNSPKPDATAKPFIPAAARPGAGTPGKKSAVGNAAAAAGR